MTSSRIRVTAICVFRDGTRILVAPGFDEVKRERFFRPLGGAVEFGEASIDALRREIREELAQEIGPPTLLGVLENRFQYRGQQGHEIVFVYDAEFLNRVLYAERVLPFYEGGWTGPAEWLDLKEPLSGPLYPDGLEQLLRGDTTQRSETREPLGDT